MLKKIHHSNSTLFSKHFDYITEIILGNYVGEGYLSSKLEKELSYLSSKKYCKVVTNGSSALFLSLKILYEDFHKNEVIVSSYICPTVINTILQAGLVPILVDINSDDLNINIEDAISKISRNTLTFLISPIGGIPFNFSKFKESGVPIIEDCCQVIGAKYDGNNVGSAGDFTVFSFGSTKMITGGIGGAILTNNEKYSNSLFNYTEYENTKEFYMEHGFQAAYNYNLCDFNSGLILSQLGSLNDFSKRRNEIANIYNEGLKDISYVQLLKIDEKSLPSFYRYYFFSQESEQIISRLNNNGIDARASIAHNIALYYKNNDLKNLNLLANQVVSLPIYPLLLNDDIERIIKIVRND
jgi:dTDP-4-amino-4,6-dideoxygalactose transaminase